MAQFESTVKMVPAPVETIFKTIWRKSKTKFR